MDTPRRTRRWLITLGGALLGLVPGAVAGPVEAAILAAMSLSDQPSYSWVSTVTDDARTYDVFGRTIRGGFTRVTMPAVNALRRRLGRSVTDTQVEFIFRGNVACVVETEQGWRRPDELAAPPPEPRATPTGAGASVTIRAAGNPVPPAAPAGQSAGPPAYSNLQPGVSHPHEDLGVIVACHASLAVEDGIASGALTESGARLLLVRDGQETLEPQRASGDFKLWLRDGLVVRYQVRLQGTLLVRTPGGTRTLAVSQVSDTVLKDVGTTRFDVPEDARVRL